MMEEKKLRSESIFRDDRRYYLDLKENHRGRYLRVNLCIFLLEEIVFAALCFGCLCYLYTTCNVCLYVHLSVQHDDVVSVISVW